MYFLTVPTYDECGELDYPYYAICFSNDVDALKKVAEEEYQKSHKELPEWKSTPNGHLVLGQEWICAFEITPINVY